jgi:hypothetical protein
MVGRTVSNSKEWVRKGVPFYDLAQALDLSYYIADKDQTGMVVDHDVNHHILLHTVTCYSRKDGRFLVPDLPVVERALEAGADPNFSYHGRTPWEEVLTGTLAHISWIESSDQTSVANHNRRLKWETDAQVWAKVMKIFLRHGASPVASSNAYFGQPKLKAAAILRYFPISLVPEVEELRGIIDATIVKPNLAATIDESQFSHGEESGAAHKCSPAEHVLTDVAEVKTQPISTVQWLLSWVRS